MSFQNLADNALAVGLGLIGETILYTPKNQDQISIKGKKFQDPVTNEMGFRPGLTSIVTTVLIRLADLPAAPGGGDTCIISGQSYKVVDSEPDGCGGAILTLEI